MNLPSAQRISRSIHGVPGHHDHTRSRWNGNGSCRQVRAREAGHSRELAKQGHLLRLWRPPLQPGEWRTLGLFAAVDADKLEEVLASVASPGG